MQSPKMAVLAAVIVLCCPGAAFPSDEMPQHLTPSLKDADLVLIADSVGEYAHRQIIVDPRVRCQITHTWDEPITAAEFYDWFISLMRELGFTVIEEEAVTRILRGESANPNASGARCVG